MKAADVIKAYKNGERNFQRKNLRGANFKGHNLSGADFSYCQIQGANFSGANLTNAKFIGAKAGLQKRWVMILLLVVLVFIILSSFFSTVLGYIVAFIFKSDVEHQESGWTALIIIIIFYIITFHKNLRGGLMFVAGAGAGAFALAIVVVLAGAFATDAGVAIILAGALAGTCAFAGAVAGAVSVAFAGAFSKVEVFVGAFAVTGAVSFSQAFAKELIGVIILPVVSAGALTLFACFIGYLTLKDETRDPWLRKIAIAFAAMGGTSFHKANLTDTDFTGATLKNTNFNKAILTRTCFKDTIKLNLARPGNTLLANPTVRDLLINPSSGQEKELTRANLRGANLKEANLQGANLKYADISEATFEYANLSHVNLTEVNAVYTNFNSAYLTGACIENWNIDATTILDNIDCQYVYLLNNEKERQPSSGDFQAGEFTELFKEVFDTVDLIFRNGIDWKAFIETMKTVQVQNEDTPLEVSSIENKGDGVFVVKVKVPPDANKEKIHQDFNEVYQLKLEAVEAKYKAQLEAKETEITIYRKQSIDMMEIVKTQASRPINVEAKTMNYSSDSSQNISIGDINNSGNLNIEKLIKDINNTINQIPETKDNKNDELKTLLQELTQAIETENELDEEEKVEAANKVKTIAEASQNPENEGLQKKASRAVKLLETLAKGLEPATKLATACKVVLPKIISLLPFLA
ncbi:MAG: pentapeptide repeat-containing protein [Crocosphaera sp.]|nr:pentapeptide repeat-containing protein [Crocosphaera sp.]